MASQLRRKEKTTSFCVNLLTSQVLYPGIGPSQYLACRAMCWHFFVDFASGCHVVQTCQQRAQVVHCAAILVRTALLMVGCDSRAAVQDTSCRLSRPTSIRHCMYSLINPLVNTSSTTTQSVNQLWITVIRPCQRSEQTTNNSHQTHLTCAWREHDAANLTSSSALVHWRMQSYALIGVRVCVQGHHRVSRRPTGQPHLHQ